MHLVREPGGFAVFIGRWSARFAVPWFGGRFGNGSRWFTGWFDWKAEDAGLFPKELDDAS